MRFLNCSPAATRRISCGSLFKVCFPIVFVFAIPKSENISNVIFVQPNESSHLGGSKSSLFAGSSLAFSFERTEKQSKDDSDKEKADKSKKLPIINPMVQLPSWPSK